MNDYDKFKLQGLEEFAEFCYYKGEKECPYSSNDFDPALRTWWEFEKNYHDNYRGKWKTFAEFLDFWITERFAPESNVDLSKRNPWKDEYRENAPYTTINNYLTDEK